MPAETFIVNYKIRARHIRGCWDGTDTDYRNVPKAFSLPLRPSFSCQQVLRPMKGYIQQKYATMYTETSQLKAMLTPFLWSVMLKAISNTLVFLPQGC